MKSPAIILSRALASYDRDGLVVLAERAGVTPRVALAAFNDRPISADHFLRLCAVVGVDPVTGKRATPRTPAPFDHNMLAVFVSAKRHREQLAQRPCARIVGLNPETLHRIENGTPVAIESVIKACAYVGLGPFEFVEKKTEARRQSDDRRNLSAVAPLE